MNKDNKPVMPEELLQIMRHSLGIDSIQYYEVDKIDTPYRNYFATTKNGKDYENITELVESGHMEYMGERFTMDYFYVTEKGIIEAKLSALQIAEKNKPTRSKRRYQAYLHCEVEESFGEWLKDPFYDSCRKRYRV